MLENYPDVLTAKQLYDILPIGRNRIYKLLADRKIKHIRMGKKIIILKKDLIEALEKMSK